MDLGVRKCYPPNYSQYADNEIGAKLKNIYLRSHFAPAFFFLDSRRREALRVLYAVCRLLDDAVDLPHKNPGQVLDLWREVLLKKDSKIVAIFGHEKIASDFLDILKIYDIPLFSILDLIDRGVRQDLKLNRFQTPMDVESYCYGVAGTVGIACLPIFGIPWEHGKDFAVRLGIAIQWTNIIRDVGADSHLGRIYLPLDHLEKFDCKEEDILHKHATPAFLNLIECEYNTALGHYKRAWELLPSKWTQELLPARIMGKIYLKLLEKIKTQGYPVLEKRISLNIFEKSWVTWTTWKG